MTSGHSNEGIAFVVCDRDVDIASSGDGMDEEIAGFSLEGDIDWEKLGVLGVGIRVCC